jgi:ABC-type multidrug transport system fused ATPase/permease subunit
VTLIHIILGLFDIVGVFLIGLVGSLAVTGITSNTPGDRVLQLLSLLGIETKALQVQVATLGALAAIILTSKSLLSLLLSKKSLLFLARRSAIISKRLINKLFSQELLSVKKRTSQESIFALTEGVQAISTHILASGLVLVADIFLITALSISLFVVDTFIALSSLILFSGTGIVLYLYMHKRAKELGELTTKLQIVSNNLIVDFITNYRELFVKNRRAHYGNRIGNMRLQVAESGASITLMALFSKYIIEVVLVSGGLTVGALLFATQPSSRAVAGISIFLVSSVRIAPAILRIQTNLVSIRSYMGVAFPTLDLIDELEGKSDFGKESIDIPSINQTQIYYGNFRPEIIVQNVSFHYPEQKATGLVGLSLTITSGQFVGIVGPSGAGKTTLVDLILGLLTPTTGRVQISGVDPIEAISKWPGAIGYVPQDVSLVSGSIKDNICLGFTSDEIENVLVEDLLRQVGLSDLLHLPGGIFTNVGERGYKLSGGQRQRIGLARGLLTNPSLLVLDEATSALDAITEAEISEHLERLRGTRTLIIIAHRLSTIRNADIVYYVEEGCIKGQGTFEELRLDVPEFNVQAKKMGM